MWALIGYCLLQVGAGLAVWWYGLAGEGLPAIAVFSALAMQLLLRLPVRTAWFDDVGANPLRLSHVRMVGSAFLGFIISLALLAEQFQRLFDHNSWSFLFVGHLLDQKEQVPNPWLMALFWLALIYHFATATYHASMLGEQLGRRAAS